MLLTRAEQERIKMYIKRNLIIEQQSIIDWLEDEEHEIIFKYHMLKEDYEQAFKLCTEVYSVHSNSQFMQYLLNMFYPSVNRDWAKYFILVQTETSDDFSIFDKCLDNECKAFNLIYQAIFE